MDVRSHDLSDREFTDAAGVRALLRESLIPLEARFHSLLATGNVENVRSRCVNEVPGDIGFTENSHWPSCLVDDRCGSDSTAGQEGGSLRYGEVLVQRDRSWRHEIFRDMWQLQKVFDSKSLHCQHDISSASRGWPRPVADFDRGSGSEWFVRPIAVEDGCATEASRRAGCPP
jgi:hypothetical protein